MTLIKVFPPGSWVSLKQDNDNTAIGGCLVTAVCIRGEDNITYEVVWWDGKTRKCEWVSAAEVSTDDQLPREIGFNRSGN